MFKKKGLAVNILGGLVLVYAILLMKGTTQMTYTGQVVSTVLIGLGMISYKEKGEGNEEI